MLAHGVCSVAKLSSPTHADMASWLFAREIDDQADPAELSTAAERVCQKLCQVLSRLVSPAGSQAIVARALHLGRADFEFLDGVGAGRGPEACLVGLSDHMRDVEAAEARAGLLTLLGLLLDLLVGFMGGDLTLRLVREVWPDAPVLE